MKNFVKLFSILCLIGLASAQYFVAQLEEDAVIFSYKEGVIEIEAEAGEFENISISEFPVLPKPNTKFTDICQNLGNTLWTLIDNEIPDKHMALEDIVLRSCVIYSSSKDKHVCANLIPGESFGDTVEPSKDAIETYTSLFTGNIIGKVYIRYMKGFAMFYSNLFYNVDYLKDTKVKIGFSDVLEGITSTNVKRRCVKSTSFKLISKNISIGGFNDVEEKISAVVVRLDRIGKTLVIRSSDSQILACADIVKEASKKVVANFDMDKVQMKIDFTQNSRFDLITLDINFGEKCFAEAMSVQVNQFPIEQGLATNNKCSKSNVGNIYDPFGIYDSLDEIEISPTIIKCSVGKVSSFIETLGKSLYGANSIVGRSISIISANGSEIICGNIGYPYEVTTAVVQFRTNPVYGEMYIRQEKNNWMSEASIFIKLANYNNEKSENHNFHIHVTKVQNNSVCSQANGHYNPLKVDVVDESYKERCKLPFRCEFGDLSMKHGTINIDASFNNSQSKIFITDEYVDLSGPFSVIDRSVVIHQGKSRLACANILQLHPRRVIVQLKKTDFEIQLEQASPFDDTIVSYFTSNLSFTPSVMNVFQVNADVDNSGKYDCSNLEKLETYIPSFNTSNFGGFQAKTQTLQLLLFNQNSVSGRGVSIAYSQSENKSDCGSLDEISFKAVKATATVTFNKEIEGTIKFSQLIYETGVASVTNVAINLNTKNALEVSKNHKFHVHVEPIGPSEGCSEAKGHYNPFGAAIGTPAYKQCTTSNTLACELGDLSKKFGLLHLNAPAYYNDDNLPLTGPNSIIGRSIVIHSKNNGASRYDCANIIPPLSDVYEICFSITQKYNYLTFIESLSKGLEILPNQIVPLHNKQVPIEINKNCHCVLAYIIASLSDEKKQSFMKGDIPLQDYSTGSCSIQQSVKLLGKESQVFSGGLMAQPFSLFYICFLTFVYFLFA